MEYAEWYLGLAPNRNIIFVDELGVNISMRLPYGRALRGKRAEGTTPAIRSRNISIIAAMTSNALLHYEALDINDNGNAINFAYFVDDLAHARDLAGLQDCIIVMDNVAFHHNLAVQDLMIVRGFEFRYLPPYSPFLNPIENMIHRFSIKLRLLSFILRFFILAIGIFDLGHFIFMHEKCSNK
jgi:hypothetical protein